MLRFGVLVLAGLAIVAWTVWASGRRTIPISAAAILSGAGVALLASMLVDCRVCRTAPLFIGTLLSAPFFVCGWIALAVQMQQPAGRAVRVAAGAQRFDRIWLILVLAASALQVVWAFPLTRAASIRGECPCMGLIFNGATTTLAAIGIDRVVGPVLLAEAAVSAWLAWRAFVRVRPRGVA